jgi:hypothetical protein
MPGELLGKWAARQWGSSAHTLQQNATRWAVLHPSDLKECQREINWQVWMEAQDTLVPRDEAAKPNTAASSHSIITCWLVDLTSDSFLWSTTEDHMLTWQRKYHFN